MWDLVVSVPDHCLSFYFMLHRCDCLSTIICRDRLALCLYPFPHYGQINAAMLECDAAYCFKLSL